MARDRFPFAILATCVVVAVLILGFLVHQSLGVKKWRTSFDDEMAQRLDLEEKVARMEKERSVLLAGTEDLTSRLEQSKSEAEDTKAALTRVREENKSLQTRLEQIQTPDLTQTQTATTK